MILEYTKPELKDKEWVVKVKQIDKRGITRTIVYRHEDIVDALDFYKQISKSEQKQR